jgi:hypothetical protein
MCLVTTNKENDGLKRETDDPRENLPLQPKGTFKLLKAKQLHAAAAEDKFDTLNAYRQQIGT